VGSVVEELFEPAVRGAVLVSFFPVVRAEPSGSHGRQRPFVNRSTVTPAAVSVTAIAPSPPVFSTAASPAASR
jgi:hypothetical protein